MIDAQFNPQSYHNYPYKNDEEINLIDLGKVFYKHAKFFFIVLAISILLALVVFKITPIEYHFQTVVEIGVYIDEEGKIMPIENDSSLISRVKSVSIPYAQRIVSQKQSITIDQLPSISVSLEENTGILMLTSNIKNEPKSILLTKELHQNIVNHLIDEHAIKIHTERTAREIRRKSIDTNILAMSEQAKLDTQIAHLNFTKNSASFKLENLTNDELQEIEVLRLQRNLSSSERELDSLHERESNLQSQIDRQAEKEHLLFQQLERAESDLTELRKSRQRVISSTTAGATQLSQTLLLIDSQINSALNNIRDLENALHLKLPQENLELRSNLVDLISLIGIQENRVSEARQSLREYEITRELQIKLSQSEIDRINAELNQLINEHKINKLQLETQLESVNHEISRIQNSRVVIEPDLHALDSNKSISFFLAIGAVLGVMLGIMSVLIVEFVFRIKESLIKDTISFEIKEKRTFNNHQIS